MQLNKKSLNPFSLIADTCRYWGKYTWRIIFLTAIVAVPGSFLRQVQFDSINDASIIASLAGLYLSIALVWAFFNEDELKQHKFPSLYINSSSRFLPYLLCSIFFVITIMPIVFGIMIIILALSGQVPMYFVLLGAALGLLELYLVVRFSLATTLVVQNKISAFNSMRLSWEVTKGSVLKIAFAWGVILVVIVIFSGLLISAVELIEFFRENIYAQAAINGLLLTFLLPLLIGYGVQIVKRIEK